MVGFSRNPEEDGSDSLQHQQPESKNLDDFFSFSLPDIHDFSLPFTDSFVDFDPIKEWLEEDPPIGPPPYCMDDVVQESTQYGSFERFDQMGSNQFCPNTSSEGVVVSDVGSREGTHCGTVDRFDQMGSHEFCVETRSVEKSSEMSDVGVKGDVGAVEKYVEKGSVEVVGKLESNVEFSIEEELGRVSLSREVSGLDMAGKINNGVVGEEASVSLTDSINYVDGNGGGIHKDDSLSESESESDSGSLTSDNSSDEDDDDDDKDEKPNRKTYIRGETELEEGEIMVSWSDEEDDEDDFGGIATKGPIRSKNEIADLPPVSPVNVSLLSHHHTLPVGIISSILGHQVIVEGVEKHNPLSEGSIIWITESRFPLGIVDEIFGPVKNPYYIVRYNSETEVPAGIQQGTKISFVPEFADHVLKNANLYQKGYDASGEHDEELSEEAEFSDDEKEAAYRRMQKMKMRGTNDEKGENRRKDKRNSKNQFGVMKLEQSVAKQTHDLANNLSTQQLVQPPGVSSGTRPIFSNGLMPSHPLQQLGMAPTSSVTSSNNVWLNGNLSQSTAGTGFPITPQMTGMPFLQGNHPQPVVQAPFVNVAPYQQNIHMNPSLPSNFGPGSTFATWPGSISPNFFNQALFGMVMQGQNAPTPTVGANVLSSGFQNSSMAPKMFNQSIPGMGMQGHNASTPNGFPQLANSNHGQDTFQYFNPGNNRGSGRRLYHRNGGRFGGGRGQRPS